jgi:hypothetical protein
MTYFQASNFRLALSYLGCASFGGLALAITLYNNRDAKLKINQNGVELKINQTDEADIDEANIYIRTDKYSIINNIEHKNIECLEKKGYKLRNPSYNIYNNLHINDYWTFVKVLSKDSNDTDSIYKTQLTKDILIEDCKECNVYTDISYKYNDILNNEVKRVYWYKCYKDELQ